MAQSMQGIACAKAGIEPSDRGDGSVSRLLWAGLTAQAFLDPGRPGVLRLYPGRPVIPGDLIYMLVPDLVAATELLQSSFGLALVVFGYAL
jgi:hypothetical protein